MKSKILFLLAGALVGLTGCSRDSAMEAEELHQVPLMSAAKKESSLEWELFALNQKCRPFFNYKTAVAKGYTTGPIYVSGMGNHYINDALWDDVFELEKPEALLYFPDANGVNQFLAVEYLVLAEETDPAPEGFTGSDDGWFYNPGIGSWTLHVWIGVENPNGLFAPMNPNY